jgi:hypothetical protein
MTLGLWAVLIILVCAVAVAIMGGRKDGNDG